MAFKLSVIIPNYNHAAYLPECLEAILSQSFQPIEVIVVDDASTDASCAVVEQYAKKHTNLKLIRLEKNSKGPIVPIQEGLKHVTGHYLALCAADDIIQPGFFEETMRFTEKHPEIGICCGDFAIFHDKKPYAFKRVSLLKTDAPQILDPDSLVELCSKTPFYIPSQVTLYKTELVLKYGGYRADLKSLSDFYLNCQIAFRHPIGYIPRLFGAYRLLPQSYAHIFRYNIPARHRICSALMQQARQEDALFQQRLRRSGILSKAGLYMIAFLMYHPLYWKYFFPAWKKRFRGSCKTRFGGQI